MCLANGLGCGFGELLERGEVVVWVKKCEENCVKENVELDTIQRAVHLSGTVVASLPVP
jgi:hypothetical protein